MHRARVPAARVVEAACAVVTFQRQEDYLLRSGFLRGRDEGAQELAPRAGPTRARCDGDMAQDGRP